MAPAETPRPLARPEDLANLLTAAPAALTEISLVLAPQRPGWLDAAVLQAETALRGSGRPRLAAGLAAAADPAARLQRLAALARLYLPQEPWAAQGLAAPQLPWRTQLGALDGRHRTAAHLPENPPNYLWSDLGPGGAPLVMGEAVLRWQNSGRLVALSLRTGALRWSLECGPAESPVLGAGEGRVLVATRDALLCLAAENGRPLWRQAIAWAGEPLFGAAVAFCPHSHGIEARRVADGSLLWSAAPLREWTYHELRLKGDWLWAFSATEAAVLDAQTGEPIALYKLPAEKKGYRDQMLLGDQVLLVAANRLLLWNPATASSLGALQITARATAVAASKGRLYLRLDDGTVAARAREPSGANELWRSEAGAGGRAAPLAAADGVLFDAASVLWAIDEQGRSLWQTPLEAPLAHPPLWDGEFLLLCDRRGLHRWR